MTALLLSRKAAEYLDDKQIEEDVEVPIDRYLEATGLYSTLGANT